MDSDPAGRPSGTLGEIAAAFGKLGLTSFGGPVAHLAYFRDEFVARRRWLSDADYADLVALCQFLPGPASSQVAFALGLRRAGALGALLASACFTLPSAALMIAFAYGVAHAGDVRDAGWLHGLKLAAVAVVAQAVWSMGRTLCPDRARLTLCLAVAAALLVAPGAVTQLAMIALGAVVGVALYRREATEPIADGSPAPRRRVYVAAAACLVAFAAFLAALPVLAAASGDKTIATFDAFYRAGSLVFGGGHVVLPLLRAEVVPHGWVTDDAFLAGYGAAQAVPGPLFSFAAYLGAAASPGRWAWAGGLWCLSAIFLPAYLLVGGALPFWDRLRATAAARAALRGANASVVGVLLAALYDPVFIEGVRDARDVAIVLAAFAALHVWRVPAWAVATGMAFVGWGLALLTA